jgi:DNA-binding transcriptional ArsR family regulator
MKASTQSAIDGVLAVDRLVHEPARLAILTVLASAEDAEFRFLETVCRLSKGNLSSHLSKLEAGGLVTIEKSFRAKRPLTRAAITPAGRAALDTYRRQIAALVG